MSWIAWKRISGRLLGPLLVALAAGGPVQAAPPGATVTAVTGNAGAGGAALERQAQLADGDSIQTGADGACSLLVDGDAILELCQDTTLRLGHRDGRSEGPRVLELRRGEIRVAAGSRAADQRIEIHTPGAIATVLGSVVYVSVDARNVTTIASAEGDVRVESSRRLGSVITLNGGQQVTLRPGAPIPRVAERWRPDASPADGCLIDFRAIAFEASRDRGDDHALDAITAQDLIEVLPSVAAGRSGGRWTNPVKDAWIDPRLHRIYDEIDTGAVRPPCSGENCQP